MKAYKYRIYPNAEQKVLIAKTFGCVRKVYNLMLADRIKNYDLEKETGIRIKRPTPAQYKTDYPFLTEVDSLSLANAQLNLNKAYQHFFRRVKQKSKEKLGFPKFKSRKNPVQSYTTNNQKGSVAIVDNAYLKLPKFKELLKIKLHRPFTGTIKSVTISKTASNRYYASILVDEEVTEIIPTIIISEQTLGLDLGLNHYLIDSLGNKVNSPQYLKHSLGRLSIEQRKLARKKKGSKARESQRIAVAKCHEKITNQRNDFLQKLSTKLAYDNQITSFAIEDLNIKGMMKNTKLSRAIGDSGWHRFITYLEYKCKELGKNVLKINRFAPSSKTCSGCGYQLEKLSLKVRHWSCPNCLIEHDRDINAAKNIKAFALAQVVGTTKYVKRSPVTKLVSDSVMAKDTDNNQYGSYEAHSIASA